MIRSLLFNLLLSVVLVLKRVDSFSSTVPEVLLRILDNSSYNFHATPTQDAGYPTNVTVTMYIEGLSSFQAQTMDFQVDLYFQETWIDSRLRHNSSERILIKDQKVFDKLWHPDVYFANARESKFHDVTAPNFLLWVYNDGTVYYDCRFVGNWSCLRAEFRVKREILHHIIQSYIPTSLIVVISWFSFWLDIDAVPGRVSLCITTLLTLATQASAAKLALPQVSYIKAIDVWMGTCLTFVFGVMIEFTMVNYWARRKQSKNNSVIEKTTNKIAAGFKRHANRIVSHQSTADDTLAESASPLIMSPISPKAPNGSLNTGNLIQSVAIWQRQSDIPSTPPEGMMETSLTHRNVRFNIGNNRCKSQETDESLATSQEEIEVAVADELEAEEENNLRRRRTVRSSQKQSPLRKAVREKWMDSMRRMRVLKKVQNRKTAQKIDQKSRLFFPLTFLVFNITYWIYYFYIAADE